MVVNTPAPSGTRGTQPNGAPCRLKSTLETRGPDEPPAKRPIAPTSLPERKFRAAVDLPTAAARVSMPGPCQRITGQAPRSRTPVWPSPLFQVKGRAAKARSFRQCGTVAAVPGIRLQAPAHDASDASAMPSGACISRTIATRTWSIPHPRVRVRGFD